MQTKDLQADADASETAKDSAQANDGRQAKLKPKVELGDETEEDFEIGVAVPLAAVGRNGLF